MDNSNFAGRAEQPQTARIGSLHPLPVRTTAISWNQRGHVVPLVPRPSRHWRCPVAGCCFAALNPMEHRCPLPAAASAAEADPVDPAVLGGALAGLRSLGAAPASPLEPTAEDFGAALAAWGSAADVVRVHSRPVAGVARGV